MYFDRNAIYHKCQNWIVAKLWFTLGLIVTEKVWQSEVIMTISKTICHTTGRTINMG